VAGATIADGAKLEKTLTQLADKAKQESKAAGSVTISAETYQGIHLHVVSMPTPDPRVTPLVGDTLEMAVGVGDDKVLVAAGHDAAKVLKKAIGQLKTTAGKGVPPLEIKLACQRIAKFAAEVSDDLQVKSNAVMLAAILQNAGGKDHVTITAQPIVRGVRVRLELEEGLLKAIGAMSRMMAARLAAIPVR